MAFRMHLWLLEFVARNAVELQGGRLDLPERTHGCGERGRLDPSADGELQIEDGVPGVPSLSSIATVNVLGLVILHPLSRVSAGVRRADNRGAYVVKPSPEIGHTGDPTVRGVRNRWTHRRESLTRPRKGKRSRPLRYRRRLPGTLIGQR